MLRLDEDEARGLDAIYKGIGLLVVVVGGAWPLVQFIQHRAEVRETEAIEARKPFEEKRLQIYSDVVSATAAVAGSADPSEVAKAKERFSVLYLGQLTLVEDEPVRDAAARFSGCMKQGKKCDQLPSYAEALAASCRPFPPKNLTAVAR
jgi:hypothetical protein